MPPTRPAFDTVVHAPHRLRICAVLDTVDQAEFAVLREATGVSESVLSKQVKALEDVGYVTISKAIRDSRVRTWARFTPAGRDAYRTHVAELQQIVAGPDPTIAESSHPRPGLLGE